MNGFKMDILLNRTALLSREAAGLTSPEEG